MKYIRTKNFIHDSKDVVVVNENGTLVVLRGIDKDFVERTRGKTWNTGTNVVLAQADTIEELCEAFIIIDEDKKRYVYLKEDGWTFDMMQDLGMWSDRTCYGAIWVIDSNGAPTLSSVAKMNDKGKLELL